MTKEKQDREPEGKRERIYESVWRIYMEGTDLGLIRMGEIAEASGVPKGTIYEYFRSKDQLIAESVGWVCDQEEELLRRSVEETEKFSDKWDRILEWFRSPAARTIFMFDFMNGDKIPEGIRRELEKRKKEKCLQGDMGTEIVGALIEAGKSEGFLGKGGGPLAARTAIYSAIAPVFIYNRFPERFASVMWEDVKRYSRKLFEAAFQESRMERR